MHDWAVADVHVREAVSDDASALADLMFRSVREVAVAEYTPEQAKAWLPAPQEVSAVRARIGDGRLVLVAVAGAPAEIVGYIELQADGHIDHFYCAPGFTGRGVGSLLYAHLEAQARASLMTELTVDASTFARRLLERRGFEVVATNRISRAGVVLENHTMVMELPWQASGPDGSHA